MRQATIVFPSHLFAHHPCIDRNREVFIVEDKRYFLDFAFHKMSDFGKGEWSERWDRLYWSFLRDQREKLRGVPRMGLVLRRVGPT
jgi:deoxyribodipyrimidine photolyase-like uncharacterized protein